MPDTEPKAKCGSDYAGKGPCGRIATFLVSLDFRIIALESCDRHLPIRIRRLSARGDVIVRPINHNTSRG